MDTQATQATKWPLRARGRGTHSHGTRGQSTPSASNTISLDGGLESSSGIKIWWESNGKCTDALVQYLSIHPADCHILFNGGGKKPDDEGPPSGSDKTKMYTVIARHVFENDNEYHQLYSEETV
ncbi:hypothetical protein BDR05DRAFT_1001567 [Suillus weaverae]|nr:hypothetical protein BDR05DRAFT_1001567 [Suillus weaverae]